MVDAPGMTTKRKAGDSWRPLLTRVMLACVVGGLASTALPTAARDRVPVDYVLPVPAASVAPLRFTGTVRSPESAQLSVDIAGRVDDMRVAVGQRVQRGEVLLRLDDTLAALESAAAEAALSEARVGRDDAQRLRDEAAPLARDGSLPKSEQRSREAELQRAEAALLRLAAARDLAVARQARHVVRAPADGVIHRRHVAAGSWLSPGDAVIDFVSLDGLVVDVRVPQDVLPELGAQAATVRLEAYPAYTEPAAAAQPVPVVDEGSRTVLLRIPLLEGQGRALPGMSALVTLPRNVPADAVAIPRDAVLRFPDGSRVVWVIAGEGEQAAARRRALPGAVERGEEVLVRRGLRVDERVVVRGNESLSEGQPVQARPFAGSR